MPPKKKIKNTKTRHVEKRNEAGCSNSKHSATNTESMSLRLSSLPSEILFYIYKFLSPADLVSLSQLGDTKLKEVAEYQRELNFTVCWRYGVDLLSSCFSRESVKHIQKLNFNACAFARPCDLVQVICRCKKLVTLSIIECGIHYKQFLQILKKCSALKELSWSVTEVVEIGPDCHSSVTKLLLFYGINRSTIKASAILKHFPKLERAIICCTPDALTVPPFNTSWSKSFTLSSHDNLRWVTLISDLLYMHNNELFSPIITIVSLQIKKFFCLLAPDLYNKGSITRDDFCHNHPPFLKVMPREEDISFLSSCNSRIYSNVIICLTSACFDIHERLFNCISKVTGSELKHLSIEYEDYDLSVNEVPNFQPRLNPFASNLLAQLLLNCTNITVLNFGGVHFNSNTPFFAMSHLKELKFLNVPTCAFPKKNMRKSSGVCNQQLQNECTSFEELVSKCCKVEEFHLFCCNADKGRMLDSEIFPVKNWKRLISFSIYSVIFNACRFLRKISNCCPEFRFFEYINTAEDSACIFYEDLIYLLKHAKNLSFIRINCKNFHPQFERFWNAVSMAKNLEGICILTNVDTNINTSSIITSITSLKYLHSFHFIAPRVSERFYAEVKKSMDRNNIKNGKVESKRHYSTISQDFRSIYFHYATATEFFHIKPNFTCEHMHLKKFLFDSYSYFDTM